MTISIKKLYALY